MEALINGVTSHHLDEGPRDGLPIVLIHGFPFDHTMWQPQILALRENYRVVAYDVRGLGQSHAGGAQAAMEDLADDLIGLLDHLGIKAAVLCGLSMGGYIALRAIQKEPGRVKALVLADTRSQADTEEAKLKRTATISDIKKHGLNPFAEAFLKTVFAPAALAGPKPCVAEVSAMIRNNTPVGVCAAAAAIMSRTDTTPALAQIKVPTLVLGGEHDALTPPETCKSLASAIPGAQFAVIPEAGHLSNLENPHVFNQHLLDFLSKLPR